MKNFLTSDNLPLNDQFIDLPYKDEIVNFTGEVSEELNDGYNNFVLVSIIITNKSGKSLKNCLRFDYCIDASKFIKNLDCNFYKIN